MARSGEPGCHNSILFPVAALIYLASGVMKVFMFDSVSKKVPSFGAYPPYIWKALGVLELACVVGLIVPAALGWHPMLTGVAAALLAAETLLKGATALSLTDVQVAALATLVLAAMAAAACYFPARAAAALDPTRALRAD